MSHITNKTSILCVPELEGVSVKTSRSPKIPSNVCLKTNYSPDHLFEIGVDECARGPMFGRLYVASVVLDAAFDHSKMRDSKKIHSVKKFEELSKYIKQHAVVWNIQYVEPWVIDQINIRQAVLSAMTHTIRFTVDQLLPKIADRGTSIEKACFIMVDGNDFMEYTYSSTPDIHNIIIPHVTVEKGDNTYSCIAAASILAKHEHDNYIRELCQMYPELVEKYGLDKNMGYGTKKHMEVIHTHGITKWHRKTFGACKTAKNASELCPPPIYDCGEHMTP